MLAVVTVTHVLKNSVFISFTYQILHGQDNLINFCVSFSEAYLKSVDAVSWLFSTPVLDILE